MSPASRSRLIAAALMVGAIAASSASAQFDLAPAGTPSGRAQGPTTNAAPGVQSNPDQQTTPSVPGGPPIPPRARASEQAAINRAQAREAQALAYSPPPAAQYRMEELDANASAVHPVTAATKPVETTSVARPNPDQQGPVGAPAAIVRVGTPSSGFDWGDAGIGAAGGFALSMLALGLVLVVSQHRARRSGHPAATAR